MPWRRVLVIGIATAACSSGGRAGTTHFVDDNAQPGGDG
jgi:hypothetical protein